MKINLFVIFFTLTIAANLFAQNPLVKQWDKRFGGTNADMLYSFQQTADGGYILGGGSSSVISGDKTQANWDTIGVTNDFWIVKTGSLGNKQWDKDFGGTNHDVLISLQQTADGGYILGGFSISDSSGDKTQNIWGHHDYWIIKIDSLGNKQWDKDFGGTEIDWLSSLKQTSDGGYILGGYSFSSISGDKTENTWGGQGDDDYWIVKIDSLGNKQWDKDIGGTYPDDLLSLQQTADGGYILGGYSISDSSGDKTQNTWGSRDYWIVKTDSLGNKQWDKDFGGTGDDRLYALQQTADGGYILGGYSDSGISGDKTQDTIGGFDYWIVKTDSIGNKLWDRDYGGTDREELYNIFLTADGGYLFSGESYSPMSGNKTENNLGLEQTWIVKTDSLGIKQWDKTIFTTGHDENGMMIQSADGCYVMANYTPAGIGGYKTQPNWDPSNFYPDYWIIKFCDSTFTSSITQVSNSWKTLSIYPNPTNSILNLFLNHKENIIITNLLGEIVFEKIAEGKIDLDISFLSSGIYLIQADNEVRKFVKE